MENLIIEYLAIGAAVLFLLICIAAVLLCDDPTGWRKKDE